ncbi:MAG: glycosyltransferase [Candidatus Sulfotelmatobacter sp.]|jgi:glycosyltransferase involved in cell wall biosynthesis
MLTIAYLANQFPATVEPYVGEEIAELRERGVNVIGCSARKNGARRRAKGAAYEPEILCLQPLRLLILLRALGFGARRGKEIVGLLTRILLRGRESPKRRLKALLHTWLGAYYAVLLRERGIDHIHVHHGYFGSWVGMVAARLLGVGFSLTLHGSDMLLNAAYLDSKLENCRFCITISDYNRRYILKHFPTIDSRKILVSRLGVDVIGHEQIARSVVPQPSGRLTLLAVGRLNPVKDHAFLIRACARMRDCGIEFECAIAGEGSERRRLELLIGEYSLKDRFRLLGHVHRPRMNTLYCHTDVVVLTSRSEGLPLVLMEAMAQGRIVLAPAITGIPEIISPGETGFLYRPGDIEDFVARILFLRELMRREDRNAVSRLDWIRHAAQTQVLQNFNRKKNLIRFGDRFLRLIETPETFAARLERSA